MTRTPLLSLTLLLLASCGGDAGTSVKSNTEEKKSRREEIWAIAEAPSSASKEVPTLIRAMEDPDPEVRWIAEFGLGRVDARGVKALSDALKDESPKVRWAAAYVLGPMG